MDKIRVGVVGAGYFGQFHAEKYARMEGVELVGVADIDPSRAREIAKRCQTQPLLRHTDLLGQLQAVSIAVPTPFHHSVTKDFFLQGTDVLLEKPISSTLEEADELIELAEQKGLVFQVGHLERFNGALSAAEGMVQNPFLIESRRLSPFQSRGDEVDVVLDLMVHDIDIVLTLVSSKVKDLDAVGLPILTPYFDIASARIDFENGCRANLTASRVSGEKIRETRIFQPGGTVTIDYLSQKASFSERVTLPGKKPHPGMVTKEIPVKKVDLLEAEIQSFLQSIRDRKESKVSGHDGRQTLEVALRIAQKIQDRLKKKR